MTTVSDGLFQYGGQPVGPTLGVGNIYYVYNTTSTSAPYMKKRYGGKRNSDDNTNILHPHTSTTATNTVDGFTTALTCTQEDRNDYVIVMPSNNTYYRITTALAVNKKAVHLICPAGLGWERGANNAARFRMMTSGVAMIAVTDAAIEIAGLYLQNADQGAGITLASGSGYCVNIHHNTFYLIWTSGAQLGSIVGAGDGGLLSSIERNWFISGGGTGITCAGGLIQIQTSATSCRTSYNEITIGNAQTATIGILNQAYKGRADYNLFSEAGGTGNVAGGTITSCLHLHQSTAVAGNRCSVSTGKFITSGGTAGITFCDNMDGVTEGTGGITTQLET